MTLRPSPNPNWKPGDKLNVPEGKTIQLDPEFLSLKEMYRLLLSAIVPRPIAFVSTVSSSGIYNLAPFSFFNGVSSEPPCVAISVAQNPDGSEKDTLRNILATKVFVVNSANEWLAEPLAYCGSAYPHGVSEFEKAGLTSAACIKVAAPRLAESAFSLECEYYDSIKIGDGGKGSSLLVVGKIVFVHVNEAVCANGRILTEKLRPLSRLGAQEYGLVDNIFDLPTLISKP